MITYWIHISRYKSHTRTISETQIDLAASQLALRNYNTKVKIKTREAEEVGSMKEWGCIELRVVERNRKSRGWSGGTNRSENAGVGDQDA